jgi:hypothetical protein
MAKKSRSNKRKPYLVAMLFCDQILEDKNDRTISLIRAIDQVDLHVPRSSPEDYPNEANRMVASFSTFLSFKSCGNSGRHTVHCIMESPSGKKGRVFEQAFDFTSEPHGGANFILHSAVKVYKGGIFWLYAYLDGKRVGRAPIRILIHRHQLDKEGPNAPDQEQADG